MRFTSSFILTALLSFAACLYLDWWSIAIAAFIVAVLIPQRLGKAFLTGFLALFFLWGALSWWISSKNEHLLAHKVSLLIFKMDSPYLLVFVSAIIGAIIAGLAALSGSLLRKAK